MQGLELEIANASTLQAALVQFCGAELLGPDNDNAYACDRCRALTSAEKHLSVLEAPPVLRIQLKRFAYSETGELRKVAHLVEFPEFLDLSPFMRSAAHIGALDQHQPLKEPRHRYRLSSVIVHEGRTPHSGHYVCYVRKGGQQSSAVDCLRGNGWAEGSQWFLANDEEVRGATPEEVRSQQAYILLYERVADAAPATNRNNGTTGLSPLPVPAPSHHRNFPEVEHNTSRFGANPLSPDYLRQLHQLRADREQVRSVQATRDWSASSASSLPPAAAATAAAAAAAAPKARIRYFPRSFPGFSFFSIKASKRRQERSLQGLGQHLSHRRRGSSSGPEWDQSFFSEQHYGPDADHEQQQQRGAVGYEDSPAVRGLKRRRLSDSWCDEDLPLPTAGPDLRPTSEGEAAGEVNPSNWVSPNETDPGVAPGGQAGDAEHGRGGGGGGDGSQAVQPEPRLGKRKSGEVSGLDSGPEGEGRAERQGEGQGERRRKGPASWLAGLLPKPVRSILGLR